MKLFLQMFTTKCKRRNMLNKVFNCTNLARVLNDECMKHLELNRPKDVGKVEEEETDSIVDE